MKILFALILTTASFMTYANHHEGHFDAGGGTLEEKKARFTGHIDEKIKHLQENRACVEAAKDEGALKSCHKAAMEKHKEMRKEHKELRKAGRKERNERKRQEAQGSTTN